MPQVPHDYEINFWIGVGDVLHAVRMEQFPNRDLAVVAGANALFEWAKTDPDKSIPAAALEYWESHKLNPALTFQDVQAELERKWGIQFGAKQVDNEPPAPSRPKRDVAKSEQTGRGVVAEDNAMDLDIVTILKRRHFEQIGKVRHYDIEIARIGKLRDKVEYDITRLEAMLASVAVLGEPNGKSPAGRTGKRGRVHGALERPAKVRTRRTRSDKPDASGNQESRDHTGPAAGLAAGFNGGTSAESGQLEAEWKF